MTEQDEQEKLQAMREAVIKYMDSRFFREHTLTEVLPTHNIIASSQEVSQALFQIENEGCRYLRKALQDLLGEGVLEMRQPGAIYSFEGRADQLGDMLAAASGNKNSQIKGEVLQYPIGYFYTGDFDNLLARRNLSDDD